MFGLSASPLPPEDLAGLLLAFARSPGNYLVRMGEPRALHAHLDTVAAWAVGRIPEEIDSQADAVREAAVFFIQRACFAPENNHYQVLGLASMALTPEALRTRYRALIRVTHPDMAVAGLPADAARVVNRANEVLSDPVLRERYDEQLAREAAGMLVPPAASGPQAIVLETGWRERWQSVLARYPHWVRWSAPVIGVLVLGVGLLVWVTGSGPDGRMLIVARAPAADGGEDARAAPMLSRVVPIPPKQLPTPAAAPLPAPPNGPLRAPASAATVQDTVDRAELKPAAEPKLEPPLPTPPIEARQSQPRAEETVRVDPTASLREARPAAADAAQLAQPNPPKPESVPRPPPAASVPSTTVVVAQAAAAAVQPAVQAPAPPLFRVAAVPSAAPPPTPTSLATSSAWAVDAGQAKTYLADLLMSLERPKRAKRNNDYLAEMNVQGSLLQPALALMRRYPEVEVEQMNWNDHNRPGAMSLRGQMTLRATNPDTGEVRKVNFRLDAEFWGTRDGTVMATLNLREDQ